MPEYVYALHDFTPEVDDEISFRAGDRIEVIEKDELYGDGWWQGRNLFGKVGLFPQSFTTNDPSVFQPVPPQSEATSSQSSLHVPLQTLKEEDGESTGVMKATLTDVQEAIEQLGRKDNDGGGSFSFASTRDGDTTDRELTDRETDVEQDANGDNGWHKGARHNLAEKARAAQAEAAEVETAAGATSSVGGDADTLPPAVQTPTTSTMRSTQPPIEVELSDESEDEEEDVGDAINNHTQFPRRHHADITEEEEDSARRPSIPTSPLPLPSASVEVPSELDKPLGTARQATFTQTETSPGSPPSSNHRFPSTPPITPSVASIPQPKVEFPSTIPRTTSEPELKATMILPSPPSSSNGTAKEGPNFANTHPSDWSVDDVVEWAKSKGFDQSVYDKFIEHEITGDVLLDLDVNLLKSELEIVAFGKRMRIANAIAELKRPASVVSSDQLQPPQHHHQRSVSQSVSLPNSANHSLPSPMSAWQGGYVGPARGDGASAISANGMPSPVTHSFAQAAYVPPTGDRQQRLGSEPASSVRMSMIDNTEQTATTTTTAGSSVTGLGISVGGVDSGYRDQRGQSKNRPAHLALSPSDTSLHTNAKSPRFAPVQADDEATKDERAVLSDTESAHAMDNRSRRRRLFGRSTASAESKESANRHSKEVHTPVSSHPGSPSKNGNFDDASPRPATRRKRSVDASKSSDRLSIFGNTFHSLGKGRKPAPRISSNGSGYAHDDSALEKNSRTLSRFYMGGSNGKKNRPVTAIVETNSGSTLDREGRDPAVLRKRTNSHYDSIIGDSSSSSLKPGQSVLEQIGEPDYTGWMRKKGEHYNTWKLRYFVLKGSHLYYLRSDRGTETKIKGYINIIGYKVHVDENVNPGKYGFRLTHEIEKTHYFCSEEQSTIREWMKALMKATIGRDYSKPVISSCNIPTIPLAVAQTMNPAPRPPSPSQRAATQKALRRENPNQLSTRDARVLMGLPSTQNGDERQRDDYFSYNSGPNEQTGPSQEVTQQPVQSPPRPTREARRSNVPQFEADNSHVELIRWANEYLPERLRVPDTGEQVFNGLALFRLAEAIKGKPMEPPVPDTAFPSGPDDDRFDGLFKLFDFFLTNDIRMGNVSINDVKQGRKDKIVQILRALRSWEEKRKNIARSIGRSGAHVGPFITLEA